MTRILLAALCVVLFSASAEARQRHKTGGMHAECNVTMPCVAPYASTPDQARVARGRYVARQMGFGSAIQNRPVRAPKARVAKVYYRHVIRAPRAPLPVPAPRVTREAESYGAPSASLGYSISRPVRYIAGRLVCAINVGVALAEMGHKGTGSALARSYDHWGRPSGPQPGAVAVTDRRGGGHVAIVSRVVGSRIFVWNATGGRHGWREIEYTKRRARYRVAG